MIKIEDVKTGSLLWMQLDTHPNVMGWVSGIEILDEDTKEERKVFKFVVLEPNDHPDGKGNEFIYRIPEQEGIFPLNKMRVATRGEVEAYIESGRQKVSSKINQLQKEQEEFEGLIQRVFIPQP